MLIISIVSSKGGSGKTTLCLSLAMESIRKGKKTFLIDSDYQRSMLFFLSERGEKNLPEIPLKGIFTADVHKKIDQFKEYENIFIDSPGHDTQTARSALSAGERLLIPVIPSGFDLWSIETTLKIHKEVKKAKDQDAYIVLNCVKKGTRVLEDALKVLKDIAKDYGCKICKTMIGNRTDFAYSLSNGMSVGEHHKNGKAHQEIQSLYKEITKRQVK